MSEPSPKRRIPSPFRIKAVEITDPDAIAKFEAARKRDDGTAMIVQDVIDSIADAPDRKRNLLNVVVRLIGHLTPEQKRSLTERLPELLASPESNGVLHSAAGQDTATTR